MINRLEPDWKDPMCLRRQFFRTNVPNAGEQAGVHYDQIFLRHGPPTAITGWIPIGDCSPMTGGLIYLEDSVNMGESFERNFTSMSESKGLSEEQRKSAWNENVS